MAESCSGDDSSSMSRSSSEEMMKPMSVETFSDASTYRTYKSHNPRRKWTVLAVSVVSFILFLTFASIYGSEEGDKKEENIEEPQLAQFAELRNLSTYQEPESSCGKRDEAANMTIWNDVVNKTSDLMDDMFTIAIQTYKRPAQLNKTIQHLVENKVPSLYEIVVVWNEVTVEPPSDFMSEHGVLVRYRKSEVNSLNQKFLPDPNYRTQGILLSDDDWNYNTTGDLEWVFQQWRRAGMHRLTGAFARCWTVNEVTETPMYSFKCKDQEGYSMILTGLAFTHISYLEYYHSEDDIMASVRKLVDETFNCEDIALNFVTRT
ncbi:exostoses 3 [Fusarium langsethiae]|uniref:Exostoses 3 n=1 Tax=Fusarium langsethiae TaxID=179993 RepID=A0A0M9EST8_FUSLA|nr:exostoses 3 [Fusarium langsethiae]